MIKRLSLALLLALAASLALPGFAFAQEGAELLELDALAGKFVELDMLWIAVATALVFLMQIGFMFLEIGFSRQKNVGAGVAKVLVNLGIVSIVWWAFGFGIAEGEGNAVFGTSEFFFSATEGLEAGSAAMGMLFGAAFAAVSLAIVWGTTLERIRFGAYVIFAIFFGALIYPLVAHAVWADGGWMTDIGGKEVLDFAGSSVVHLTGATAGLACLLLLGSRRGKYGPDGRPRAIPGHSMPLVGLGVMILWIGWFGFNGGSTFETDGAFFGEVMLVTQLSAAAGVLGALLTVYARTKALDVGMAGNGAIAGLVGITAGAGYVEYWAAPLIGLASGVLVVISVLTIERYLDDPVGAISAHGAAGIWGTFAVGIFGAPRLVDPEVGSPGIWYGIFDGDVAFADTLGQLGVQTIGFTATFVMVLVLSGIVFWGIRETIGLRVSEAEELAGLDISTHGMYGYPEQFIPREEYPAPAIEPHVAGTPLATNPTSTVHKPTDA